jgi:hypothetical protein
MSAGAQAPLKLFISYAHADDAWRSKLAKWLKPLEHEAVFQVWHDRQQQPGEHGSRPSMAI